MKISINWLSEYVRPLPSPETVAAVLTASGLEVEEVVRLGRSLDDVVVGRVLDVRRHPNADRLTLCRVDAGTKEELQIVCGAPNVAAGQLVPVARVGATLELPPRTEGEAPQRLTIERRKVRGEVSEGMICAEDELGLSDDHSGIMVLEDDAEIGRPFADYLQRRGVPPGDHILDVSITPNRPDATSHFGVARDVAALTSAAFTRPDVSLDVAGADGDLDIAIEDEALCPRYVGVVVRGVTIGESPEWLKQRLVAIGLRPRNNVVDVTNYVMFECGQPLHAFDLNRLAGGAIRVRTARGGETFTTLDDQERTLPEGALLICDAERAVAVAGVMGGENSEVDDSTTDLLIESAYFDPSSVRKTARALGLQTDSSYRFERGVDRDGQAWAAARAAELITRLAGGTIGEARDVHPVPPSPRVVRLRQSRVAAVLGVNVAADRIRRDLTAIGFDVRPDGEDLLCTVPTFRPDVEREIDVIEEVARLFGYDNIPAPARTTIPNVAPRVRPVDLVQDRLTARLAALGLHEVHTNSMLRRETADRFCAPPLVGGTAGATVVETLNPISREMATLRPSLLPGMLQVMAHNNNHGQRRLAFFEIGHVFLKTDRKDTLVAGYDERHHLLVAVAGEAVAAGWNEPARPFDVFDAKGVLEHLLTSFGIDAQFVPGQDGGEIAMHHARIVSSAGSELGVLATLSDGIQHGLDLPSVHFAELDMEKLVSEAALDRAYAAVSRYPTVERDIAVVVPKAAAAGDLMAAIRSAGGELLQNVALFDLYEGERLGGDRRSLAFNLVFGTDRTLTDSEVDEAVQAVIVRLQNDHDAELRQ